MKIIKGLSLLCLLGVSCDIPEHYFTAAPECRSAQIFSHQSSERSTQNQSTLRDKIRTAKPEDYRYFFKTFVKESGNSYMITNFRNEAACFDIKMLVNKWDKLGGMHRVNGKAYPNELYDLKWKIVTINGKEEVLYKDMHEIID